MIPIAIVTGFLGAGKTSLINGLLSSPDLARTAVIVNEFGEIGLDHELITSADETLLTLTNGCLCCASEGDFSRALGRLERRSRDYDRIIIETSGLADPGPILRSLVSDRGLNATHRVSCVMTLIDPVTGEKSLEAHPEARRQVMFADTILYSKPDLGPPSAALVERLRRINPDARHMAGFEADTLFRVSERAAPPFSLAQHSEGLGVAAIVRDQPLPALALVLLLEGLTHHCGDRLLRLKGLVNVAEHPEGPALVQFVQGAAEPPTWMPDWPSQDRSTRLVIIGQDIPPLFPARLLDMIVDDVVAESERIQAIEQDGRREQ